jgi:hypothetical protein
MQTISVLTERFITRYSCRQERIHRAVVQPVSGGNGLNQGSGLWRIAAKPTELIMSNTETKWTDSVNRDYEPISQPDARLGPIPPTNIADRRTAHAAEYSAYHLGQIGKKLDRLIAAVEALSAKS